MAGNYLDIQKEMKLHVIRFRLVPDQLNGFRDTANLVWHHVPFREQNSVRVPDSRGVYAFVVASTRRGLPRHGYVMYIGKAGDGNHSLRKRFRDYIQAKKVPKRHRVYSMLNDWKDVLCFFYAQIADMTVNLRNVELALNDAMLPPMVRNDFSAGVRHAINAFET